MSNQGIYDWYRRQAEELAARHDKPQRAPITYAPGSMEWKAEQEKLKRGGSCG